jgi:hypothetical protein
MIAATLDKLHDRYPGCETLAFADLSTQMVLITNAKAIFRREALDALGAEAALVLGTNGGLAIGGAMAMTAFVATRDHLRIYLRSARDPNDALCCVCAADTDIDSFLTEARACLDRISDDA